MVMMHINSGRPDLAVEDIDNAMVIMNSLKAKGVEVDEEIIQVLHSVKASANLFFDGDTNESLAYFNDCIREDEDLKNSDNVYDKSKLANNYYDAAQSHLRNDNEKRVLVKCV